MLTSKQLRDIAANCGQHELLGNPPPKRRRERELWGLIEILDFDCEEFGHCSITAEQAREYLLAHREEVLALKCAPPSCMGLACGVLYFLRPIAAATPPETVTPNAERA